MHGGFAFDGGCGAGAVCESAHEESLRRTGLGAVVGAGGGEGLHVRGEDGLAPRDGEVFSRGQDERYGGSVVAYGGPEGYEEAAFAGLHEGGGEDDGGLGEAALHGGDCAGVVGSGVVGESEHGCA